MGNVWGLSQSINMNFLSNLTWRKVTVVEGLSSVQLLEKEIRVTEGNRAIERKSDWYRCLTACVFFICSSVLKLGTMKTHYRREVKAGQLILIIVGFMKESPYKKMDHTGSDDLQQVFEMPSNVLVLWCVEMTVSDRSLPIYTLYHKSNLTQKVFLHWSALGHLLFECIAGEKCWN